MHALSLFRVWPSLVSARSSDDDHDYDDEALDHIEESALWLFAVLGMLLGALVIPHMLSKWRLPVPQAILVAVLAMIFSVVGNKLLLVRTETLLELEQFTDKHFMLVFLAPIIFAEGYGMKSREFFSNITRICAHAFFRHSTVNYHHCLQHILPTNLDGRSSLVYGG